VGRAHCYPLTDAPHHETALSHRNGHKPADRLTVEDKLAERLIAALKGVEQE
jgi:hypothetical protein